MSGLFRPERIAFGLNNRVSPLLPRKKKTRLAKLWIKFLASTSKPHQLEPLYNEAASVSFPLCLHSFRNLGRAQSVQTPVKSRYVTDRYGLKGCLSEGCPEQWVSVYRGARC